MNCPACAGPLEELLIRVAGVLHPCGIYRCARCECPDNRWVFDGARLVRRAIQAAAVALIMSDLARILFRWG